jgi:lipoprotein-anchoring transpeptidase ErfK/SrfK
VALPGRPNGATGWVIKEDLELFPALRSIEIDLSERALRVIDGEEIVFTTQIGVGSPSSPTPPGSFFITDAVIIQASGGPWGPYAFGLSARSDTVTEFNGGDGIIGIHGTNRPRSIGSAQSLGCVRLPNEMITELFGLVGVGTPVVITG